MSTLSTPLNQSVSRSTDLFARVAIFAYGLIAYGAFVVAFTYAVGFVGNWLVPKGIDSGTPGPLIPSLLINALLLSLFVIQHTIMARPWFKRAWTTIIPRAAERSTYVLLASTILLLIFWQWRPLPTVLWSVTGPAAWILNGLSLLGYAIVFAASCMISHLDLFGVRQSWLRFRGMTYRPVGFRLVGLYRLVRHPLMLGFLVAFWSTPTMTVGQLFFSLMTTAYIFIGIWFEERDLVAEHGESYLKYRRSTRAIIPLPKSA